MTEITHHSAIVNGGVRIHYALAGSGTPVVLLHGLPQTWYEWRHVIPRLAERHTVIAPDLRGCGYSGKPASGYDLRTVAEDIYQLVRELGHRRVAIAATDFGAGAAYEYAAAHRDAVERLAFMEFALPGFGLLDAAAGPQPGGGIWHLSFFMVPDIAEELLRGKEAAYIKWVLQFYAYNPSAFTPQDIDVFVEAYSQIGALRAHMQYYQELFADAEQNRQSAQEKLSIPVLALGGSNCLGGLPLQSMQAVADDVRGGVIERCGHWVAEERPDYISERLLAFFGGAED